jgi:S1-C subfamily serine protease
VALVTGGQAGTGAVIQAAIPGTAAARVGLGAGDVIVSLGGHKISAPSDVQKVMELHHPGDSLTVTWVGQDGQTHSGTIVLTKGPAG